MGKTLFRKSPASLRANLPPGSTNCQEMSENGHKIGTMPSTMRMVLTKIPVDQKLAFSKSSVEVPGEVSIVIYA